ncbi:MAG: hypothetical protein K2I67_01105 [Malacoplasma sp.]|nr:hypothetical protein [Malacoplasma sp.]
MANNEFEKLDREFKKLQKEKNLNINSIEDLMIGDIDNYKLRLKTHIEELLSSEIDEKELIAKKNKNGKKKDSN